MLDVIPALCPCWLKCGMCIFKILACAFLLFIQSLSVSNSYRYSKKQVLLIEDLGERGTCTCLFHYKTEDAGECSFLARHSHSNFSKLLLWSYGPDLLTRSLGTVSCIPISALIQLTSIENLDKVPSWVTMAVVRGGPELWWQARLWVVLFAAVVGPGCGWVE